jgi:hypothetical protein
LVDERAAAAHAHAGRHAREHHPFIGESACAESLPELSARNDVEVRCDVNAWVDIDATVLSTRDAGVGRFGAMVDEAKAVHRGESQQEAVDGLARHRPVRLLLAMSAFR